ncbi:MAG: type 4a pilus biogenesis protein PilO [Candidatus Staskawiczbacteria bacterium]|nr:type 4a pilus biogenesis protein PilO [Candidatus Staskawiczbacteria bacterium]
MTVDRPIAIALILFIILLLVFFLVVPEYNAFTGLQTELGQKKAEFRAEYDYYAGTDRTYFDLQSRKDDIKKIDDALPQDPSSGKLIYFLQKTAKDSGLILKDIFLSKPSSGNTTTAAGTVKTLIFSLDLSGSYESLLGFMMSLEKSSRIFEVTGISFSSPKDSAGSFSLQVKTYSY